MVAEVVISLMERLQPPAPPIEESPIGLGEHKRHLATPVSSVGSVGGKCQRLENTETPHQPPMRSWNVPKVLVRSKFRHKMQPPRLKMGTLV